MTQAAELGARHVERDPRGAEGPLVIPPRVHEERRAERASPGTGVVVRLGRIDLTSLLSYLLMWAAVLLGAWVAVCAATYAALLRSGALASVSRSVATVLDVDLADSGLLPVFTWTNVLVVAVLSGALLVTAWFLATVGAVLVHNGLSALVRAPRVRLHR